MPERTQEPVNRPDDDRPAEQVIVVTADGRLKFVWDDALAGLVDEGRANVTRAGEVEPDANGHWLAVVIGFPAAVYGPYPLRQTAIDHERAAVTGRLLTGQM